MFTAITSLLHISFFFLMLSTSSSLLDTITMHQNFLDGHTIVSPNGMFEFGFFSPVASKDRYVGIWFRNMSTHTVAWVANSENPLLDTSGVVRLSSQGVLWLVNGNGTAIWSSNSSVSTANVYPVAQLLDTGNLVIKNANETDKKTFIWESFNSSWNTATFPTVNLSRSSIPGGIHFRFLRKRQVIVTITFLASMVVILALYTCKRKRRPYAKPGAKVLDKDLNNSIKKESIDLIEFTLSTISRATNKFSLDNKLGEGGFGPVYKGVLEDGNEIAVKRLSRSSTQGLYEFENEVICIAKLQHRNIVRLLGSCLKGEEIMLVYEYMPNKSLDWFLFDDSRKSLLDWPLRFRIIQGIARGLLYLHQDSRLRVVHRDLKASNVLLDREMNPKISDFGLARMLEGNECEEKTKKVVGTLGYISPEYAANGLFSIKSDIFSYGVLVLEIVCGKKNRGFVHEDHQDDNLIGHAWRLYTKGMCHNLTEPTIYDSRYIHEVLRSIHIGLLCVQQRAEDRPNAAEVVAMLASNGPLPSPKQPAFFFHGPETDLASNRPSTINVVTLSQIDGR